MQSFIDREAAESGRLHTRAIVEQDLLRLHAGGITNLNVDLIAGLAGQTFASWEESVAALVACGVPHASVYMLEVDEDSRLGREMLAGGVRYHAGLVPSDDAITQMYTRAVEVLSAAGLDQYEISNFSRMGFHSRHNQRYWERRPYLGLGLDASSMLRETLLTEDQREPRQIMRSTTTSDLAAYLAGPQPLETEWLSADRQHEEAWFLGLRLNAGVSIAAIEREFGAVLTNLALAVVARLERRGLLMHDAGFVRLTAQGRLLSNDVFQEFLDIAPEFCPESESISVTAAD